MLDYKKAKKAFEEFVSDYDITDGKINLKLVHTFGVVKASIYLTNDLSLSDEDKELAKLIALLHDIGRFEQAKKFDSFVDFGTLDHAEHGVKILFNEGLIRNFIDTDIYDNIIYKAISNHSKLIIEEGLSERELLHAKLIRDADKMDNFRVKATEDFNNIANTLDKEELENDCVSEKVYNEFMKGKTIISRERETKLDMWVSYIAFIFDINFIPGLKYIKERNYINILIDRLKYNKLETKKQMENIREFANKYIEDRITSIN